MWHALRHTPLQTRGNEIETDNGEVRPMGIKLVVAFVIALLILIALGAG